MYDLISALNIFKRSGFIRCIKRLCAAAALLTLTPVFALQQDPVQLSSTLSQSQAIDMAKQMIGGRVLRVDNTQYGFRVKLLQKSGRVVTVDVNRDTGQVRQLHASEKKKG